MCPALQWRTEAERVGRIHAPSWPKGMLISILVQLCPARGSEKSAGRSSAPRQICGAAVRRVRGGRGRAASEASRARPVAVRTAAPLEEVSAGGARLACSGARCRAAAAAGGGAHGGLQAECARIPEPRSAAPPRTPPSPPGPGGSENAERGRRRGIQAARRARPRAPRLGPERPGPRRAPAGTRARGGEAGRAGGWRAGPEQLAEQLAEPSEGRVICKTKFTQAQPGLGCLRLEESQRLVPSRTLLDGPSISKKTSKCGECVGEPQPTLDVQSLTQFQISEGTHRVGTISSGTQRADPTAAANPNTTGVSVKLELP
ncbi:translation initiation factor IF-2-like [Lutra lutra]|uniref:translation initiation factor IF-2-like n=1 Tax=Lutra lutra TaxID=9657 RepID=UPI001FD36174|nr:translation initiation factor IF-2-like [Lutra lutra]